MMDVLVDDPVWIVVYQISLDCTDGEQWWCVVTLSRVRHKDDRK